MSDNIEVGSIVDEFYDLHNDAVIEIEDGKPIEHVISIEPVFKYKRVEHGLDVITRNDSISCLAVHQKFIALGTDLGRVHLLDHSGNQIERGLHAVHSRRVNQISISRQGEYIVSCSDDGMVVVYDLGAPESEGLTTKVCQFHHPIKSVAIAPNYSRKQGLVFGFSKLNLISRGALNRRKHTILTELVDGLIRDLRWRRGLIIWADDERVGIYDICARSLVTQIQYKEEKVGLFRRTPTCFLGWQTDTSFAIGRGLHVHVCELHANTAANTVVANDQRLVLWSPTAGQGGGEGPGSRRSSSLSSLTTTFSGGDYDDGASETSSLAADTGTSGRHGRRPFMWTVGQVHQFSLPASPAGLPQPRVVGLSRHQGRLLVVSEGSPAGASQPPVVDLLTLEPAGYGSLVMTSRERVPDDVVGGGLSSSSLPVPQDLATVSSSSQSVVLALESIPGEDCHYLVSAKRLMCATKLSADDRIDWLIERDRYMPALEIAQKHRRYLSKHSVQSVGVAYMDRLLQAGQFSSAAELLPQVLEPDKVVWEEQILKFVHLGQLQALAIHIPTSNDFIQLESRVYERLLIELMNENADCFCQLLQTWGKQGLINNYDAVLSSLLMHVTGFSGSSEPDLVLQSGYRGLQLGLAHIYAFTGHGGKAVDLLVALKDPAAFDLVDNSGPAVRRLMITEVLRERIVDFMQLDEERSITLLLDNVEGIPPDHVVEQLEPHPRLLYRYLDSVYNRLPQLATPHLIRLIQLYIRFNREKLLPLLQSTDRYPLSEALNLCQQQAQGLVRETVYLLTRVGRRQDALRLLLTKGGDPDDLGPTGVATRAAGSDESEQEELQQTRAAAAAIAYCREQDFVVRRRRLRISTTTRRQESHNDVQEEEEGVGGELWLQVVLYAVDKPAFVRTLLQHAGAEGLDARLLLRKLSPGMCIPELKKSLVKLLGNHRLQLNMHRSCANILRADVHMLLGQLLTKQTRRIRVDCNGAASMSCSRCQKALFVEPVCGADPSALDPGQAYKHPGGESAIVFKRCTHVFHRSCSTLFDNRYSPGCPICCGGN